MKITFAGTTGGKESAASDRNETEINKCNLRRPISMDELQRAQSVVRRGTVATAVEGIWALVWTIVITITLLKYRAPLVAWGYLGSLANILGSVSFYLALRDIRPKRILPYIALKLIELVMFVVSLVIITTSREWVQGLVSSLPADPQSPPDWGMQSAGNGTSTGSHQNGVNLSKEQIERLVISGSILCVIGIICACSLLIMAIYSYRALQTLSMDRYCSTQRMKPSRISPKHPRAVTAQPHLQQRDASPSLEPEDTVQYTLPSKSSVITMDL